MTTDAPALQSLQGPDPAHDGLVHGPVSSLVEAAAARGAEPADVVRTLTVRRGDDDHLFVLVPGLRTLSWPRLRAVWGCRGCHCRTPRRRAVTGYERGTITPLGATRAWPVVADERLVGRCPTPGAGAHGLAVALDAGAALAAPDETVADVIDPQDPTR